MEGPLERPDPARMRVSDADRNHVADLLREAAGDGRIDFAELDDRLEAAFGAKTYADLVPLTADLPVAASQTAPVPRKQPGSMVPAARFDSTVSVMGGVTRKGLWEVGPTHTAFAMMAGIVLDLREASFTDAETVIQANTIMGGIDIWVNESTHVIVDGIGIMGGFDHARDKVEPQLGPDSPTVRVKGFALMGGVTVQRKPMPSKSKGLWRR